MSKLINFLKNLRKALLYDNKKKLLRIISNRQNMEISLLLAVEYRCSWFVKALLENGADPNYKDDRLYMSSLHIVSMFMGLSQCISTIKRFASLGRYLNSYNYAPITENFEKDSIDIAEALLAYGADINSRNKLRRQSPLHVAVESNNINMVKFLLSKRVDIDITDLDGRTSLHYCFEHNWINIEIVKELIIRNTNVNRKDKFKMSAFNHLLIHSDDIESARCLLEAGANPNDKDEYVEKSMLQIAVTHKRENILKLLLDYGADINYRDVRGYSSLHYSVVRPDTTTMPNIVKVLVENGSDINIANNILETPIFKASNSEIVKYLIENGADINVVNNNGYTLLSSRYRPTNDVILPIISIFTLLHHFENINDNPGFIINLKTIMESIQMMNIKNKCDDEINKLKEIKLHSGYTADIFLYCKNIDLIARFVNHIDILNIHEKFTIYGDNIDKTINKVKERIGILNNAIDFMEGISFFHYLPYHVKRNIF
ncbi:SWPV1-006 [Shearwaterpox virus]|uniref:SWPV1-006 n=1 Tax=Shearwaterpox virus TaxID=1974596 RepID=A0A1V0S7M1_CNPV|nr:SWPV1-006 [Shearwaterpox virus]